MKRARLVCCMLALANLGWGGCGDNGPNLCQPSGEGRIAGTVRAGGVPLEASVRATRITAAAGEASYFEATMEPDGSYAIDVAAGRYVVGLRFEDDYDVSYVYAADAIRCRDALPDTLQVDSQHSPERIDFDLGSLRVQLELLPQLDSDTGFIRLHRRGPAAAGPCRYRRSMDGTIRSGMLDVVVAGILPGSYKVEVWIGYDEVRFWIPGVRDSAASASIEVRANVASEVTARFEQEPARIQGQIRGAWLDFGLRPPELYFYAPDSSVVHGVGVDANDGRFDVSIYFPSSVKLLVRNENIHQWIGGDNFADATVFALEPGRTISGIEFVQCGMFVEVSRPFPNLTGARFNLFDVTTSSIAASWFVQYDSDVVFGIPNLRPGTYRIQVEPTQPGRVPWAPQWCDRVSDPAQARMITIAQAGEIVRVPVALEKGGTIAGTVRGIPGDPGTSSTFVYITPADDLAHWGYVFANGDALAFVLQGLPDGDWKVGARRYEFNPGQPEADIVWYPGTTDWEAATVITTRDYEDITGIEIVLPGDP